MYDDYGYLIHSAKGSSWSKKDHKYKKKVFVNGQWKYIYTDNYHDADDQVEVTKDGKLRPYVETDSGLKISNVHNDSLNGGEVQKNQIQSILNKGKVKSMAYQYATELAGVKEAAEAKRIDSNNAKQREQDARISKKKKKVEKLKKADPLAVTGTSLSR